MSRLPPNATDREIAAAFVYGPDNQHTSEAGVAALLTVIAGIREDERRRVGREIGKEANRIYNNQEKDYPSNTMDAVSLCLTSGAPIAYAPKTPRKPAISEKDQP